MKNIFYTLKRVTPPMLKNLLPVHWRTRLEHKILLGRNPAVAQMAPALRARLALPPGETEASLFAYLAGFHIENESSEQILKGYLEEAFRRFLYTLQLVPPGPGKLLEVGASPYFISLLLRRFTEYDLTFTNFFGPSQQKNGQQVMANGQGERIPFDYFYLNVEESDLPFADDTYDVILLCEVLEHFTNDPLRVLLSLKRVLEPGGALVLTTPNVNRLENVGRLLAGHNIYSGYSGHGPYGRHNREYHQHELKQLLNHAGFEIDTIFTSDIAANKAARYFPPEQFLPLLRHRQDDLGEYIFVRARNTAAAHPKKPRWLYKDYPAAALTD